MGIWRTGYRALAEALNVGSLATDGRMEVAGADGDMTPFDTSLTQLAALEGGRLRQEAYVASPPRVSCPGPEVPGAGPMLSRLCVTTF